MLRYRVDGNKFVPRADFGLMSQRAMNAEGTLADEKRRQLEALADQAIQAALAAAKITPATKDFYQRMCNTEEGLASFREFVAAAPVLTKDSGLGGKKPEGETALNAEAAIIANFFGHSIDDVKKYGGE